MDILDFEPILKTRAIIVRSAANKTKDAVVMIAEIGPGEDGPPMHIHPHQQETYEVLEGEAEFFLGNKTVTVKKGEKVDIPANTPHTFRNPTNEWLRMKDVHEPALSFEEMMRELHGLVKSGKVRGSKDLRSMIYFSLLWVKHQHMQRPVRPPFFVMKVMAGVGRVLGFRLNN